MRRGDIIVIRYRRDFIGFLIRKVTHSQYNHTAWVLNRYGYLLEARVRGIGITHINKYKNKFLYKIQLKRIKNIDKKKLDKAIKLAYKRIGRYKRFNWFLTICMIFLDFNKELPRLTCSGLIAYSLSKVGFYFRRDKKPEKITPKDISNSKEVHNVSNEL